MKQETKILEELRKRLVDGYDVQIGEYVKTNRTAKGIKIQHNSENIGTIFYIDDMKNEAPETAAEMICEKYRNLRQNEELPKFRVEDMTKEMILQRITASAISQSLNTEMLKNVPHKKVLDLAITYKCILDDSEDGVKSFVITYVIADRFGISLQELEMAARRYEKQKNPYRIATMDTMIFGDMEGVGIEDIEEYIEKYIHEQADGQQMYVLTNKKKFLGASVIADESIIGKLADLIQSDLIILPSSIHEILAIPEDDAYGMEFCRNMVANVNNTCLEPEEILSSSVYRYKRESGMLEIV